MSDLKYRSLAELKWERRGCWKNITYHDQEISRHKKRRNEFKVKLDWIEHYIEQKSEPREMTISQIEDALGWPVKIVGEDGNV